MRCPTCEFAGTEHSVKALRYAIGANANPVAEFWDEHDVHHIHDPAVKVGPFFCSNGHEWQLSHSSICLAPGCEWNLRPEVRGQLSAMIPGRNETMASFRIRKIDQFLLLRRVFPVLKLENSGPYFGTFVVVNPSNGADLLTGQLPRAANPKILRDLAPKPFVDVTDEEAMRYFNGRIEETKE